MIDWNLLVAESTYRTQYSDSDICQYTEVSPCLPASVSPPVPAAAVVAAAAAVVVEVEVVKAIIPEHQCAENEELAQDDVFLSSAAQPVKELQAMLSISRVHGDEHCLEEESVKLPQEVDVNKEANYQTYDVIIGSDLVYCKEDSQGILMVLSKYLSDNGIFIIVLPEAAHRYDTEHLVPTLQDGGFEVYYKTIAHSECKSSEVTRFPNGTPSLKRLWTSARLSSIVCENFTDDFSIDGLSFSTFLRDLVIVDDHLVSNLDEEEFVAWQLIVGHRR